MSTNNSTAPLYVQFVTAVKAELKAMGLPAPTAAATETGLPENNGWIFLEFGPHGGNTPALIIPKSKTRMGVVHSHIDLSGQDGFVKPVSGNGRVVCHLTADVKAVASAAALFVNASKRPVAAPVRRLPATSQPTSQASVGPTPGDLEIASWSSAHIGSYSDDEANEALLALNNA